LSDPCFEHANLTHVTASGIIVGPRGIVLHRHRILGTWVAPGGHIDAAEAPWDAARREAAEETGLAVDHLGGVPTWFTSTFTKAPTATPISTCATCSTPATTPRRKPRRRLVQLGSGNHDHRTVHERDRQLPRTNPLTAAAPDTAKARPLDSSFVCLVSVQLARWRRSRARRPGFLRRCSRIPLEEDVRCSCPLTWRRPSGHKVVSRPEFVTRHHRCSVWVRRSQGGRRCGTGTVTIRRTGRIRR
jgi:8-oxo-dGTP pyrophosphatase MutT (NUDIX family)